jgi:hypothetical protein
MVSRIHCDRSALGGEHNVLFRTRSVMTFQGEPLQAIPRPRYR